MAAGFWVDNCIAIGTRKELTALVESVNAKYSFTSLGEVRWILGMPLEHDRPVSHSICIPDYFHFQPDTPNTPECHPHYAIRMTTSINSESIINNTVGSINHIAVALDT